MVAKIPIELETEIVILYTNGKELQEIAKEVSVSRATVWNVVKRNNLHLQIPQNANRMTEENLAKIITDYRNGMKLLKICSKYQYAPSTVLRHLRKNGIDIISGWAERRNTCHICDIKLTDENYDSSFKFSNNRTCKKCAKILRFNIRRRLKLLVVNKYGGKCDCCGIDNIEFLTIDHPNNDGAIHRKTLRGLGTTFYAWLKKNEYPEGFRVLCFNCNCSRGGYGYCPHEKSNS